VKSLALHKHAAHRHVILAATNLAVAPPTERFVVPLDLWIVNSLGGTDENYKKSIPCSVRGLTFEWLLLFK